MTEPRKLPITKPSFDAAELEAVRRVLESGWVVQGAMVQAFEAAFASFSGIPHAVATTSCTTALHLALIVSGLRRGDEVIVPAFTFIATANAVEYLSARPVFCDIDLDTFNVDPNALAAAVRPETRGIVPVHLFGLSCDMTPILETAQRRGLAVVEDAACAVGAGYHGRHVGGFGEAGCFSFHPRKAITTGEGGMIMTHGAERAARLRALRDHGARKSDLERHSEGGSLLPDFDELGFNYRMTDIQGGIAVEQMKKLPAILARRRQLAARYDQALTRIGWLQIPHTPAGYLHGYQSYVARVVDPDSRTATTQNIARLAQLRHRVMTALAEIGVATRQGTHAVHLLGYYRDKYGLRPEEFPQAWIADQTTLTLPLYPQMLDSDVEYVTEQLDAAGRKSLERMAVASAPGALLTPPARARTVEPPAADARKKRVLVVGATGFIGGRFLAACAGEYAITALVRRVPAAPREGIDWRIADLAEPLDPRSLPEYADAVIHLAQSNRYRQFPDGAEEVVAVNIASTLALANWARRAGCLHFIFASTAGFNSAGCERTADGAPIVPDSFYTRTKQMAEELLQDYSAHITVTVLRPYTIYGPDQDGRLIPSIVDRVAGGSPVLIEGDEQGMRLSPLHVRDAARALRVVLDRRIAGHMNLAGDEIVSVREIAVRVGEILGVPPRFEFRADRPARVLVGANRLMMDALGTPLTRFREGLEETVHARCQAWQGLPERMR